jgi:hypothetical protein
LGETAALFAPMGGRGISERYKEEASNIQPSEVRIERDREPKFVLNYV